MYCHNSCGNMQTQRMSQHWFQWISPASSGWNPMKSPRWIGFHRGKSGSPSIFPFFIFSNEDHGAFRWKIFPWNQSIDFHGELTSPRWLQFTARQPQQDMIKSLASKKKGVRASGSPVIRLVGFTIERSGHMGKTWKTHGFMDDDLGAVCDRLGHMGHMGHSWWKATDAQRTQFMLWHPQQQKSLCYLSAQLCPDLHEKTQFGWDYTSYSECNQIRAVNMLRPDRKSWLWSWWSRQRSVAISVMGQFGPQLNVCAIQLPSGYVKIAIENHHC